MPGQFSPEAHFSKMIHTGKKSISLSSDELSVLSVSFYKEAIGGREEMACTLNHTHKCVRTHSHYRRAISADSLLTVELGHAHKSPKHRHAYKHALLYKDIFKVTGEKPCI